MSAEVLTRVRLNAPAGYAVGKNADGGRHLSNGATGTIVAVAPNLLRVSFDFPDDGTYDLPSKWFVPVFNPLSA